MHYIKTVVGTIYYIGIFISLLFCYDLRCDVTRLLPEYHSQRVFEFFLDPQPEPPQQEAPSVDNSRDHSWHGISPSWENSSYFDPYENIDREARGYAPEPITYYDDNYMVKKQAVRNNESDEIEVHELLDNVNSVVDERLFALQEIWPDALTMEEEFDLCGDEIEFSSKSAQKAACARYESRKTAYEQSKEAPFVFTQQQYQLSNDADELLRLNQIDKELFLAGVYNPLQHQIHVELIDIVEQTVELINHPAFLKEYTPSTDYIVNMSARGVQFNKIGDVIASTRIADYCWSLIDCGKAVLDGVVDAAIDVADYAINHKTEMFFFGLFPVVMGKYYTAKFALNVGVVVLDYATAGMDKLTGTCKDFNAKQKEFQALMDNATLCSTLRAVSGIAARMYFNGKLDKQVIKYVGVGVNAVGRQVSNSIPISTLNDIKLARVKRAADRKAYKAKGREKAALKKVLKEQEKKWEEYFDSLSEAERVEELKYRSEPKNIYKTIKSTGERCRIVRPSKTFLSDHIDSWAEAQYNKIRRFKNDVEQIARNTGLSFEKLKRIKDHLFYNKHILKDGNRRFHADIEIAAAWDRLQKGDFIKNDLALLEHEYAESRYESIFKTDYRTAHDKIIRRWFWDHPEFEEC